jgi:hypothetical protein
MTRHRGPVLVDTNVILECWRADCWRPFAGGYGLETVEECITETQNGFQNRRAEIQIDPRELRASLRAVHQVGAAEMAAAILRDETLAVLDLGERTLWAHALTRHDAWVLCGPDKASMRFGVRLGFRERLVALETLLADAGHRARALQPAYTAKWLETTLSQLAVEASR